MPVRATCSAAPERSWTERSWRPATGRMSTGQRRGEERRPCAVLKLDWAERRDPTGAPDRIASADRPCRADWTAASPWWMWSAATTTSMTAATAQTTTRAITTAVILHRLVWCRRPGASVGSDPAARSERAPSGSRLFTAGSVLREPCTLAAVGRPSGGEETSASLGPSGGSPSRRARPRGIVRLLCHRSWAL